MGWLLTGVLAGVYNLVLWLLPVRKMGYDISSITGGLLIFPIAGIQGDFESWPFIASYLVWHTAKVQDLRKGWGWSDFAALSFLVGTMGYLYLNQEFGFTFNQLLP